MKLKTFLLFAILLIGLLFGPLAANAEKEGKVHRMGWLGPTYRVFDKVLLEELRKLGWVKGENFVIEYQSWGSKPDQIPALAAELARHKRHADDGQDVADDCADGVPVSGGERKAAEHNEVQHARNVHYQQCRQGRDYDRSQQTREGQRPSRGNPCRLPLRG